VEPVDAIPYPEEREPAPGRLALVQRFANTIDMEHGREMLSSPERLVVVLRDLGFDVADATAADLRRAHELRDALRGLALANNGVPAGGGAAAVLEQAAAEGRLTVRYGGGARLEASAPGVPGALGEIAGVVAAAMLDGTWSRLKACRREVCQWLFYDRSRNSSARWCVMSVCGNRTKTRAYRARRR
jgi:predicted RNA-binding Zn ribbon-like protein